MSGAAVLLGERLFAAARVLRTIPGGDFKLRKDAETESSSGLARDTSLSVGAALSKPQRSPANRARQQQSPNHEQASKKAKSPT